MESDHKVILVLSDGLRFDTAVAAMGYLGHLADAKLATLYKVIGELPTMSCPMYETIHTGLTVSEHGIVSNLTVRRSGKWRGETGDLATANGSDPLQAAGCRDT